jgi:protein-tyrosine-phosphatase
MSETAEPSPVYKTILRKLVPAAVQKERGIYLRLGPKAGAKYLRLRLFDMLSLKGSKVLASRSVVRKTANSFVFVCFGNIMRSPMAEQLMKQEVSQRTPKPVRIASAGLHATPGKAAHPWSIAASADFGISLENHRAQLLTAEMMQEADAIFAMDFQNKAELLALYPDSAHKIFMLSAYLDGPGQNREIPDPYYGDVDATRSCYRVLQTCVRNLSAHLFPFPPDDPSQH